MPSGIEDILINLSNLQTLVFQDNGLQGDLSGLLPVTSLQHVSARRNAFRGPLSHIITPQHVQLQYLDLSYNRHILVEDETSSNQQEQGLTRRNAATHTFPA